MIPDHYAVLGVQPGADARAIRSAYLKMLREHHPDRNPRPEAAARTQAIIEAFKVLGDTDRRARYDWDRRRARDEADEAGVDHHPVSRAALAAGGMALIALAGLTMKPNLGSTRQPVMPEAATGRITVVAPVANPNDPRLQGRTIRQLTIIRMKPPVPRPNDGVRTGTAPSATRESRLP